MATYSGAKPQPAKRDTNVSTHATTSAAPTAATVSKESKSLTAMSRIAEPHVSEAVKADTTARQNSAKAKYHANPEQAQEDVAVTGVLEGIFGSVETDTINAEIAKADATVFTQGMLKYANQGPAGKLTEKEFQVEYNKQMEAMLDAGDYNEDQRAAVRNAASEKYPQVANQQSRNNLKHTQEQGALAAQKMVAGEVEKTDFSKATDVAELKTVLKDKKKVLGTQPFDGLLSGAVKEELAAGNREMYDMVMADDELFAGLSEASTEDLQVHYDKWLMNNDATVLELRSGLMIAQQNGDVGLTEHYAKMINANSENKQSVSVNDEVLRAQNQAIRMEEVAKEKASRGPTDAAELDSMLLNRATKAAQDQQKRLIDKQQSPAGLTTQERSDLDMLTQEIETGLSNGQVAQWMLDDKASALNALEMLPGVKSKYGQMIASKTSLTAPVQGEDKEERAAREQDAYKGIEFYDRMSPQLRKTYVSSKVTRDKTEIFIDQYGLQDQEKLTNKFHFVETVMSDKTDYTLSSDEDVKASTDAFVENLEDGLPWLDDIDDNSKARLRTQYSANYRQYGPDYANMITTRDFKENTVMMGDKAFVGMESAHKALNDAGINNTVVEYIDILESTDANFADQMDKAGMDIDDGNFTMTHNESTNSMDFISENGTLVSAPIATSWEALHAKDPAQQEVLKNFSIKAQFAPQVMQSLRGDAGLTSDKPYSKDVLKEYNVRSKDKYVQSMVIQSTILAEAAGLTDEEAGPYIEEVRKSAMQVSADKEAGRYDRYYKSSGNAEAAVQELVMDIPNAPEGFGKKTIALYRKLVTSGQVTAN